MLGITANFFLPPNFAPVEYNPENDVARLRVLISHMLKSVDKVPFIREPCIVIMLEEI